MKLLDIDLDAEPIQPYVSRGTAAEMSRKCDDRLYEMGLRSKPPGYDQRHPRTETGAVVLLVDFGTQTAATPSSAATEAPMASYVPLLNLPLV